MDAAAAGRDRAIEAATAANNTNLRVYIPISLFPVPVRLRFPVRLRRDPPKGDSLSHSTASFTREKKSNKHAGVPPESNYLSGVKNLVKTNSYD
jgi:hypothetical protein